MVIVFFQLGVSSVDASGPDVYNNPISTNDGLPKNNGIFNTNNLYMNWTILILFGIFAVALIIFLVVRNQKDEKVFEDQINNDYHKSKDEEGDAETDPVNR